MIADELPDIDGPAIVCAQAGEINSGGLRPVRRRSPTGSRRGGGWLHVDGAFGLWALADPTRAHLVAGLRRADSLGTDGHKWLNVTYDCGIVLVRRPGLLPRTFSAVAGYLPRPRHLRGDAQHAAVVAAGAPGRGVGGAAHARTAGDRRAGAAPLRRRRRDGRTAGARAGFTILNDVVLNQVVLRLDDVATDAGPHRRGPGRRSTVVRPDDLARGSRRCASACRRGRRRSTTAWPPRTRSSSSATGCGGPGHEPAAGTRSARLAAAGRNGDPPAVPRPPRAAPPLRAGRRDRPRPVPLRPAVRARRQRAVAARAPGELPVGRGPRRR